MAVATLGAGRPPSSPPRHYSFRAGDFLIGAADRHPDQRPPTSRGPPAEGGASPVTNVDSTSFLTAARPEPPWWKDPVSGIPSSRWWA